MQEESGEQFMFWNSPPYLAHSWRSQKARAQMCPVRKPGSPKESDRRERAAENPDPLSGPS